MFMFMFMITVFLQVVPKIGVIRHDLSGFPIQLVGIGVPQTEHALIQTENDGFVMIHELTHALNPPAVRPFWMFKTVRTTLLSLQFTHLKRKIQQDFTLNSFPPSLIPRAFSFR
jgi:hypothetical protein